jgi:hypothetical protein
MATRVATIRGRFSLNFAVEVLKEAFPCFELSEDFYSAC